MWRVVLFTTLALTSGFISDVVCFVLVGMSASCAIIGAA
jgi:hypothetical protein